MNQELIREKCMVCGMTANLDPEFHHERYDHVPEVRRDGVLHRFSYTSYTFEPVADED